jgi:hypothetical protein
VKFVFTVNCMDLHWRQTSILQLKNDQDSSNPHRTVNSLEELEQRALGEHDLVAGIISARPIRPEE